MRRIHRALGAFVAVLLLAGCAGAGTVTPRPLTIEEAERLAILRYWNYDASVREISASILNGDLRMEIVGWVDFVDHHGYANATETESDGTVVERSLLRWDSQTINVMGVGANGADPTNVGAPPLPIPTDGWTSVALQPEQSYLTTVLVLLLGLGSDRPENPQLLVQSAARWIRADTVRGQNVDVMSGPNAEGSTAGSGERMRYWVGDDGMLLRLELQLGGADSPWSLIDFTEAHGVVLGEAVPTP